jgi:PAS domain S-box-containing protein
MVAREGEDGQPPDDGATLEAMMTRAARMALFAVGPEGRVAYASPGVRDVLGFEPEELVNVNLLDYLHPDDVERAVLSMTWRDDVGQPPPGTTTFRARHKALGYVEVETTASHLDFDGREYLAIYARPVPVQPGDEVLALVARGAPRAESLTVALSTVEYGAHGAHVAIAWPEGDGTEQVSTGLPEGLTGVQTGGTANPWAACLRTRRPVRRSIAELDDATAALASGIGLAEVWVEPVFWSEDEAPALVTIWAPGGLGLPEIHGYGMRLACHFVELVLQATQRSSVQAEPETPPD